MAAHLTRHLLSTVVLPFPYPPFFPRTPAHLAALLLDTATRELSDLFSSPPVAPSAAVPMPMHEWSCFLAALRRSLEFSDPARTSGAWDVSDTLEPEDLRFDAYDIDEEDGEEEEQSEEEEGQDDE